MTLKDSGIAPGSGRPPHSEVAALRDMLAAFAANSAGSAAAMRTLQKSDPAQFARAAVRLLGSAEASHGLKVMAQFVASDRPIIDALLLQDEIPLAEAVVATRRLSAVEANFDAWMIRKIFHDFVEVGHIPASVALRLLELLDQSSKSCAKLAPQLIRFVQHPSKQVRSKSVLLLGRGNLNLKRTLEYLSSGEPRVRANALESLWDHKDAGTRGILLAWSQDPNSRVMVNALVGLCRLGDGSAPGRLAALADAEDPVTRAGAAWGMGQVRCKDVVIEFRATLGKLAGDSDQKVRDMARSSLERLMLPTATES